MEESHINDKGIWTTGRGKPLHGCLWETLPGSLDKRTE